MDVCICMFKQACPAGKICGHRKAEWRNRNLPVAAGAKPRAMRYMFSGEVMIVPECPRFLKS